MGSEYLIGCILLYEFCLSTASVNVPISEFADVSTDTNLAVVPELYNLTTVDEPNDEPFVVDVPHAASVPKTLVFII